MSPQRRPSGGSGGGRGRRGEYARKYTPRRKVCTFCVDKISYIDYKDVPRLRRYLSERGKIEPRRKTGTCAKHQRALAVALKRARHVALMPYTAEHIRLSGMVMRSPDDRRRGDDRGPRGGYGRPAPVPAAAPAPEGAAAAEPNGAAAAAPDGTAPADPGAPAAATALTDGDAVAAVPADATAETTGAPAASEAITPAPADAAAPADAPAATEGAAAPVSDETPRPVTAGE